MKDIEGSLRVCEDVHCYSTLSYSIIFPDKKYNTLLFAFPIQNETRKIDIKY